jgi:hypothetical protein
MLPKPTPVETPPRWRWLIPFVMLVAAAIACDGPYYAPPSVRRVASDPDQPGRVYAWVFSGDDPVTNTEGEFLVYETDDQGQSWRPSAYQFAETPVSDVAVEMNGETLTIDYQPIWSFPRPMFRFFFLNDDDTAPRFSLPFGAVSNVLHGDTLYVAMGTQGVLVGRLTAQPALIDWQITSAGIDVLNPLPLTITNAPDIVGIVALALLIPPFALLHAFLLYCLWVYLLPPARARLYALLTTLALVGVAVAGVLVWLTDVRTDYYPMVAAVTAVVVITGVALTLWFAHTAPDAPRPGRLMLAAALLSLIIPAGVAAIWTGWWLVYLLVFGYGAFRWAYFRALCPPEGSRPQRWLADRLAMQTTILGGLTAVISIVGLSYLQSFLLRWALSYRLADIAQIVTVIVALGVSMVLVNRYAQGRLRNWAKRKPDESGEQPITAQRFRIITLSWIVISALAAVGTFAAQAAAYSWFTGLLG